MKCRNCNKEKGIYIHYDGGKVCDKCLGKYFTCPHCGRLFEQDDYENGDQGTGCCRECKEKYDD